MVTVRVVEPEDVPVLWAMAELPHTGATADPSVPVPLPTACTAPDQFPDLADPFASILGMGGNLYVAETDGHLVGMASFRPTSLPARAEVTHVRVHPALRRRGIGRELMAAVEAGAASRGFKETWLDTATNMPVAMSFYEGLGYTEVGRETRPDWHWTLVYYLKNLPAFPPSQ
ncbi:GNAT family N-acetyltransferase [Actinopolymorpha sp. B17G11]|uniref:GNAT family N-acetyltransferase n=1 Tax=Actinopolymorpha sp. B17G11 TaxID=3160861 RepID=UPI0032E4F2C5